MAFDLATILIVIGATLLLVLFVSARRVPEGCAWTVERAGSYHRTLRPGLRWVIPLLERIGARQDLRERQVRIPLLEMLSRDRISVGADAVCFFQVVDPARASYEVADLEQALTSLLGVTLRNQVAEQDMDGLLAARAGLGAGLLAACEATAASWGVHLTRVELETLRLPEALLNAVADERTTELERRAAVLAAEGERRATRLKAEAERDARIMAAEATAQAANLDAEARERHAEAEARASLMLSRAVAEGSPHALNYLIAQQYVEALKTLAASENGRFVVLPLEQGGLAASLDGIRALAEAAFAPASVPGRQDQPPEAAQPGDGEPAAGHDREPGAGPALRPFQPPDVDGRIG